MTGQTTPLYAYVGYVYYRVQGLTPAQAQLWSQADRYRRVYPEAPYTSPALETHYCLRLFQVSEKVFIAFCGFDGRCDRRAVPRFHAAGATAKQAYAALYREMRQRYQRNDWQTSAAQKSEAVDLLFFTMGW